MKLQRYYDLTSRNRAGLIDFRQEMSRLFDQAFPTLSSFAGFQGDRLSVDLYRDDTTYFVRAELPGVPKDDIEVEFADGWLTIGATYRQEKAEETATKEGEAKPDQGQTQRLESTSFSRQVRVPDNVDATRIGAKHEDGVLTLTLPLKEEAKPRSIDIKIN